MLLLLFLTVLDWMSCAACLFNDLRVSFVCAYDSPCVHFYGLIANFYFHAIFCVQLVLFRPRDFPFFFLISDRFISTDMIRIH